MTPGELLAAVVRTDVVESVHTGHLLATAADGTAVVRRGDPGGEYFPRSSLKPLQALAMVRAGLDLPPDQLAVVCASHSGEPVHRAAVRAVLTAAHLDEDALQNTPDLPLDPTAARAAVGPAALTQNCSGKHAGMLATCRVNGWDTETYLRPEHPLQQAVRECVAQLTGDRVTRTSVDGCGAPLFSCTLRGLARAFARLATADPDTPEGRVAAAMRARPDLVGGTGRDVTAAMRAVPGLIAKDGAEGVYAAALPGGGAVALKVADGSARARAVALAAALAALGVPAGQLAWSHTPVLGHGHPVGRVVPWDELPGRR